MLCYLGGCIFFGVRGHRGQAEGIQGLKKVYTAADPSLACFYTNSFPQKLKFTEPVLWRRYSWRPFVTLTGMVDVAAFQRDMIDEPFVSWYWGRVGSQDNYVYHFTILHRMKDHSVVNTDGTLDPRSGALGMQSYVMEVTVGDHYWNKLSDRSMVVFTLDQGFEALNSVISSESSNANVNLKSLGNTDQREEAYPSKTSE